MDRTRGGTLLRLGRRKRRVSGPKESMSRLGGRHLGRFATSLDGWREIEGARAKGARIDLDLHVANFLERR